MKLERAPKITFHMRIPTPAMTRTTIGAPRKAATCMIIVVNFAPLLTALVWLSFPESIPEGPVALFHPHACEALGADLPKHGLDHSDRAKY